MFFHIHILYIGSYFKTEIGENCPGEHIIDSMDRCKNVAEDLGLPFMRNLWEPEGYRDFPAGCVFWDDKVDFNKRVDPSKTKPENFGDHGGICKNPSKRSYHHCLKSSMIFLFV